MSVSVAVSQAAIGVRFRFVSDPVFLFLLFGCLTPTGIYLSRAPPPPLPLLALAAVPVFRSCPVGHESARSGPMAGLIKQTDRAIPFFGIRPRHRSSPPCRANASWLFSISRLLVPSNVLWFDSMSSSCRPMTEGRGNGGIAVVRLGWGMNCFPESLSVFMSGWGAY